MKDVIRGRLVRVGRDVDTDQIIAARYLTTADPQTLAEHLFEDCPDRPEIEPGVIVAAGENFGSGSSREHAPLAILGAGVAAVLAENFARIFFRNAVNIGLLALEVPGVSRLEAGQEIELDLKAGRLTADDGTTLSVNPVPDFIRQIIDAGGLINWIKAGGMSEEQT